VIGGVRKGAMGVFDALFVCVCFEVGVLVGCGLALWLRDKCLGPNPYAYKYVRTGVVRCVERVSICDLIGVRVGVVVTERLVVCFNVAN
jgi:hypothetical protein